MPRRIVIKPLGWGLRIADLVMVLLMYVVSGTLEKPQKTHRWNNIKLQPADVAHLSVEGMVTCKGIPSEKKRGWHGLPLFHMPIFGGWKSYKVLEPQKPNQDWFLGWIAGDVIGISRITLRGAARALVGPDDVSFFAVSTSTQLQLVLSCCGEGKIGDGGPHRNLPFL